MGFPSLLLLLGLLLIIGAFVARPFAKGKHRTLESGSYPILLAEHDRLLEALREMDFDFSLGKVPEDDYATDRAELVYQGALIMKKLDKVSHNGSSDSPRLPVNKIKELSDDEIEELIAKRRSSREEQTNSFCPKCGRAVLSSDQYCSACGKSLGKLNQVSKKNSK